MTRVTPHAIPLAILHVIRPVTPRAIPRVSAVEVIDEPDSA